MEPSFPSEAEGPRPLDDADRVVLAAHRLDTDDGLPPMDRVLRALIAAGPASGYDLARWLTAADPDLLIHREGFLYPVLAGLLCTGEVEASWRHDAAGVPVRVYRLAGLPFDDETGEAVTEVPVGAVGRPAPRGDHLAHLAHEVTRSIPDPVERHAARTEIQSHLVRTAARRRARGDDATRAVEETQRAFGDPWKIRTDLGRVHRGATAVVFPRGWADRARSFAIYDARIIAAAIALVLLLRVFVVQAYNIPTTSMEPTLRGSEVDPDYILVDKTAFYRRAPHRWEVIVFYPPRLEPDEEPTAFVKRCVALGGETLDIRGGDIWIDGQLARRPLPVESQMMTLLYDLSRDLAEANRRRPGRDPAEHLFDRSWGEVTGAWSLGGNVLAGRPGVEDEARLRFLRPINSSYWRADGTFEAQYGPVGDAEVRCVVATDAEGTVAGIDLTEHTDRHRLRIGPDGVTLESGRDSWSSPTFRLLPGRPVELRFRNVDDRLTVWVDGELVFREELPPRGVVPAQPYRAGVELVTEGAPATFRSLHIDRDISYERYPGNDEWEPLDVPDGHLFMMGDNPDRSNDSRMWGPVDETDLIGSPFVVLYPLNRFKPIR